MKKYYTPGAALCRRLRQLGLAVLLAGGMAAGAQAQALNYFPAGATSVTSTFTDLAATGTVIATANTDDANSVAQNIGFTFNYNGASFTQFVLNTNGFVRLGAAAPSAANMFQNFERPNNQGVDPMLSTNPADVNLLLPFNMDLQAGTSPAEYRVSTTGTAPNQVCTIQWKNVSDKPNNSPSQYASFTFQLKLYQTTNVIEFVYNAATPSTNAPSYRFSTSGIKGSGPATGQNVLATNFGAANTSAVWSTTTFFTGQYNFDGHAIISTVSPDAGRTYRLRPALVNDAEATVIYTYGKLARGATLPHAVQAVVTNRGFSARTNLPVTLNVTGANTFANTQTIASLPIGDSATVTFAALPATMVVGTNLLTVTVPADDNLANNTATYNQLVNDSRITYLDATVPFAVPTGIGDATSGSVLAAKYNLNAPTVITDVALSFAASTFATTTYRVVLYAPDTDGSPGPVLYTSPTQTRPAAASNPVITIPTIAVPASFFIGVQELDNFYSLNCQSEIPLKPGTYYAQVASSGPFWIPLEVTPLTPRLAIEFGTVSLNCQAPTAVAVSNVTATTATVAFTPAATGVTGYQIVYGPVGFNPATGGTSVTATTSPVTLTGLSTVTNYEVYVRSNCTSSGNSAFTQPVGFRTPCDPSIAVTAFPYSQPFDVIETGQTLPCGITTLDANADGTTWRISTERPNSGANSMRYNGLAVNNRAADDWFFTPQLALSTSSTTRYQVAFRYRAAGVGNTGTSLYTESLEVKSGPTATAAGQTNLLYTNGSITNLAYTLANGTSTPVVALLPAGASPQYVGFRIKSAANQGNLYVDDLTVTAMTVTATSSEALLRAVSVFPNPSATGVFTLAITNAQAKQALEVEVLNNLGQRVYTGTARDNTTNTLDLHSLAAGYYHLVVRNGDEVLHRQLSIIN
jgi:hypothetical protein